jgi:hypothetical protein
VRAIVIVMMSLFWREAVVLQMEWGSPLRDRLRGMDGKFVSDREFWIAILKLLGLLVLSWFLSYLDQWLSEKERRQRHERIPACSEHIEIETSYRRRQELSLVDGRKEVKLVSFAI